MTHTFDDIRPERLEKLRQIAQNRQSDIVIVLEDIYDPHNAEAVFRTCDAFGIQTVHLIFDRQRPFNPRKVGKATSSSANKWLDFECHRSTRTALSQLKQEGYTIVGTTLQPDSVSLFDADFQHGKWAILLGNEHSGLSDEAHEWCDIALHIPMAGLVQSLNLSVTAAIVMFEVTRQRLPNRGVYQLAGPQLDALVDRLVQRSQKTSGSPKIAAGTVPMLGKFGGDSE